jgi:hypothetical protein
MAGAAGRPLAGGHRGWHAVAGSPSTPGGCSPVVTGARGLPWHRCVLAWQFIWWRAARAPDGIELVGAGVLALAAPAAYCAAGRARADGWYSVLAWLYAAARSPSPIASSSAAGAAPAARRVPAARARSAHAVANLIIVLILAGLRWRRRWHGSRCRPPHIMAGVLSPPSARDRRTAWSRRSRPGLQRAARLSLHGMGASRRVLRPGTMRAWRNPERCSAHGCRTRMGRRPQADSHRRRTNSPRKRSSHQCRWSSTSREVPQTHTSTYTVPIDQRP